MSHLIDFSGPTQQMSALVTGTADSQLDAPTPSGLTVAQLLGHVHDLAGAFRDAAAKVGGAAADAAPGPATAELPDGWRALVPERLAELARAWSAPAAWEGMTRAGGLEMPGDVAAAVAWTSSPSTAGTSLRRPANPSCLTRRRSRPPSSSAPPSRTSPRRGPGSSARGSTSPQAPRSWTGCWVWRGATRPGEPPERRPPRDPGKPVESRAAGALASIPCTQASPR